MEPEPKPETPTRIRPDQTPGVSDVLAIVWENLPLLIGGVVLGLACGLFAQSVIPKAYESKARFVVGELPYYDAKNRADAETERQLVETMILTVPSREMRMEIARSLGVDPKQLSFVGLDLAQKFTGRAPAANIRIDAVKETRMGEIGVVSQSPEFAAKVANAILDQLQYFNLVGGRLKNLRLSIDLAKAKTESTVTQLVSLSAQRIKLEQENAELDNHVRQGLPLAAFPTFSTDATLNNLKTQLILTESEYDSIAATSTRGSRLTGKRAELGGLRKQIKDHVERLAGSLRSEYDIVKTQEADVEASLKGMKSHLDEMAESVSRLSQSLSDPSAMRAASAESSAEPVGPASVITTIDRAAPREKPIQPKLWLNLLLGLVFGAGVGGGLTALRLLLDTRLKSVRQIEQRAGVPTLAVLPKFSPLYKGVKNRSVFDHPPYPTGLGFLRSELLRAAARRAENRILGFTPADPKGSTSPLVASLAILLAQAEKRTLVIDLHFESPRIAGLLGIRSSTGLSDWLSSEKPVDDYISYSAVRELAVLTPGSPNRDIDDLLARRPLIDSLPGLLTDWDFILIDAPSILSDWTMSLSLPTTSPLVITARYRRTHVPDLILTAEKAQNRGWRVAGVALQNCPPSMCPAPRRIPTT